MYCKTCGAKMNDNAAICVKCGCKKFVGNHFCPVCGSRTSEDQKICTKCQSKLVTFPSLHEMKKGTANKKPSKARKTLGTIFLILGIILIIVFVFMCVAAFSQPRHFEIPGAIPTFGGLFLGIGIRLRKKK